MGRMDDAAREDVGEGAHDEGTGIADKHPILAAEDVTEKEGDKGAGKHDGEHGEEGVVVRDEIGAADGARDDTQPRGEAVHAVHHIQGIHQSHAREERYHQTPEHRDFRNAEESHQRIDAIAESPEHKDDPELDEKLHLVGDIQQIVEKAEEEHDGDGRDDHV